MATIRDVAKYAGVSHGTVSNVLKGVSSVSLENVRKVEQAIQALGYTPDASARSLKMEVSRKIGIVLPNITDYFYAQFYTQLSQILRDKDFEPLLYITEDVPENERVTLSQLESVKPAGIVLATCRPNEREYFSALLSGGLPAVFIERDIPDVDCNFVGFRNDKTIHYAVKTLLNEGYAHIGLIAGAEEYSSEQLCVRGYFKAFEDAGLIVEIPYIRHTSGRNEDAFTATVHLLSLPTPPDAIICTSTQLASGVLGALKYSRTETAPRVVTLGEDSWNDNRYPSTTLLPRSSLQMSDIVAQVLLDNIQNNAFFERRKILLNNIYVYIEKPAVPAIAEPKQEEQSIRMAIIEGDMANALRALLPELKRTLGISVELEKHPHEDLYKVLYDHSNRSEVDVFSVDVLWLREMASRGLLADLTSVADDSFLSSLDVQPELFDDFARYNGKIYALPYQYCNQLLFYRKDLFDRTDLRRMFYEQYHTELKCPESWSEFNAVAKFFTKACNPESPTTYGTTLGCRFSSAALCEYLPRFWSYGAEVFDHHDRITLDSPSAIKALINYCESFRYANPASVDNWWHEQVEEFSAGDTAMMVMYSSYVSPVADRSRSKVIGKVGFGNIPGNCPVLGGWTLAINRNSKKYDTALAFLQWACDKKNAIPLTLLGSLSACQEVYRSNEIRNIYPWVQKSLEIYPTSHRRYLPPSGEKIGIKQYEEIIAQAVCDCVTGKDEPESALQKAAQKFNRLLE